MRLNFCILGSLSFSRKCFGMQVMLSVLLPEKCGARETHMNCKLSFDAYKGRKEKMLKVIFFLLDVVFFSLEVVAT